MDWNCGLMQFSWSCTVDRMPLWKCHCKRESLSRFIADEAYLEKRAEFLALPSQEQGILMFFMVLGYLKQHCTHKALI